MIGALCISTLAAGGGRDRDRWTMDVALHFHAGTTEYYAVQSFARNVQQGSDGRITVRVFPASQLGSEMENIEQVRSGFVQMSVFGDVLTSQLAPEFDPTVVPFIFPTFQDVANVLDGPLGTLINNALSERGNQTLIGIQMRGPRRLTSSFPIRTPADLAGVKLRVPEIPRWVAVWGGLGTLPTPVAFAEVYNALQTGVVDAQENPIQLIYSGRFFEVNRYVMLTDHVHTKYHWTINNDFLNSLPPDLRTLVLESAAEACAWGDQLVVQREQELMAYLSGRGVTFIEVDKQLFINAARPHVEALEWDPRAREIIMQFFN